MTTLTIDQHKQAVKLGIAQRDDGLWGFKKKCAHKKCDKVLEDHCYATDSFEEAVTESAARSAYTCSRSCFVESKLMYDFIADSYDISTLAEVANITEEKARRIRTLLRQGIYASAKKDTKAVIDAWYDDLSENYGGEGDMDNYEVGCEI